MGFSEVVWAKARELNAGIVLPEAGEERMQRAAVEAVKKGVSGKVFLIEDRDTVSKQMRERGIWNEGLEFIDIKNAKNTEELEELYYELRKHRGVSRKDAAQRVREPLLYGAMMVKLGLADGMVAGAVNTSAEVLRTAITVIGAKEGYSRISTCAVMVGFKSIFGSNGEFIFADVSLGPVMTPQLLAETAIQSADSAREFLGEEPVVAMLSYSTKGSARHDVIDRIIEATTIAKKRRPDLCIDGELQADAAIVPQVAAQKCPDSPVKGRANVLVFPDLNSSNIGTKLAEYLGGGKCYGPILQGMARPMNDLSRGCTPQDIVNVMAITAVQSSRG